MNVSTCNEVAYMEINDIYEEASMNDADRADQKEEENKARCKKKYLISTEPFEKEPNCSSTKTDITSEDTVCQVCNFSISKFENPLEQCPLKVGPK